MPSLRLKRYLLTGLLTFIPLWVTWAVFKFVLGLLAGIGAPLVNPLLDALSFGLPTTAARLRVAWITSLLALLVTLVTLYLLGWLANRIIGKRLLNGFDMLLSRIPLVQTIYGGTKKLMTVLQKILQGCSGWYWWNFRVEA